MAFLTDLNDNSQTVYAQQTAGVTYGRPGKAPNTYELPSYPTFRGGKPSTPIPDQARVGYQPPQQQAQYNNPDLHKAANLAIDTYADQHAQSVKSPVAKANAIADADRVKNDLARVQNGEATASEVVSHPWYADKAAHKGLITAGLAIMSGANPLEAFQMASEASDKAHVGQSIQNNRNDYVKQGYTQASIDQAIAANDPGMLQKSDEYLNQQAQNKLNEQRAYNESQTADQRAYEEKRTADQRAYEEKKAAAATTEDWAKLDANTLYNKRTGETKPLNGALTSDEDTANMSIADRNNYIITKGIDPITKQPVKSTQLKQAQDWDKGNSAYANTKAGTEEALTNISYILDPSHESDFNSAFGGIDSRLPTTRAGTAKMEGALETLKSQSFLDSIKAMRGMGSLSDAEGQKLVSAIGVLKPDMPQKALRAQVEQIREHLKTLQKVSEQEAKRKGYVGAGESSASNSSNAPETKHTVDSVTKELGI